MSALGKITKFELLSTTALSTALPALAEEASEVEEIIVTATRRAERIEDIPYNISVVSGNLIDQANMLDAPELLRSATGVSMIDRGPRNAGVVNSIRIRGLNVDSSALGDYAVSASATVSAYINDTPMFANLLIKDLDRVEILRGPQGTLYGSGALAGTVRFMTRKPELGEFSGQVSGSLSKVTGSNSVGWTGDVILNVPLGDSVAFRGVFARQDFPGLTDYVNVYELDANGIPVAPNGILDPAASYRSVKDADTYAVWFGRASLLLNLGEAVDVVATYTYQSTDSGGRRAQSRGTDGWGRPYERYEVGSVQLEPATSEVNLGALEANIDLGFATLTSSTSYFDHTGDSTSENTGFYAQNGWLAWYYTYPRPMASAVRTYQDKAFVQEVRLVSNNDGPINYVVGLYYQNQDKRATQQSFLRGAKAYIDALFGFDVPWVSGDQDFDYRLKENFKEMAIFGELTYSFTEAFDVTAGIRYFDNKVTSQTFMALPFWTGLFPDLNTPDVVNKNSRALFKGNATYHLGDASMIYGIFSQGFRRGGANGVPDSGNYAESPAYMSYAPDFVDNYELGFKGATDKIRYNLSLFYVDWRNPQINTATPNWGFFMVGSSPAGHKNKATTKGLEVELSGNLTDTLQFTFGYAYANAKLKADFIDQSGRMIAAKGARLPGAPRHSVNMALDYTFAMSNGAYLITHVDGYLQSKARNSLDANPRFDETLSGYSIWNISETLSYDNVRVSLWVKNIFNALGISAVFKEEYMGTLPSAGYFGNGSKEQIALPRTFGASVYYNF